ncbi:MAG TPA: ABC transporter permease subunit [Vicinamibacterales bacterium]|nr:ABC transporter permease subunit [Vicinamibacterales bacterium]
MRLRALLAKEFLDIARNRGALAPVALVTIVSLVIPFAVVLVVPAMTGQPLGEDPALARLGAAIAPHAAIAPDIAVETFLFQQFLLLFLLTPITAAMSLAAHAVVGEKQARTLEPLLATPVTTLELLMAKVLGALVPTLAISAVGLALYVAGIALFAHPGVFGAMATARTLVLIAIVGPATALASLQTAIVISSRVNDARTAQQFGVLIVLPVTAIFVAQFFGAMPLTAPVLLAVGLALLLVWLLLVAVSVALFDRETILTRWR